MTSKVLFVCTGNQCRSPMAAAMLRHLRPELTVTSAGLVPGGVAASDGTVRALESRGLYLDHVSRQMERAMIDEADIAIGMARRHAVEIVVNAPEALHRTFTLKDFVRRAGTVGPRPPAVPLNDWLLRVDDGRHAMDLVGENPEDDVGDPMGHPQKIYDACAAEVESLVTAFADLAFPVRRSGSPPRAGRVR